MEKNITIPRVLIGAASSSSGKTTIVCGVLKALLNRKMNICGFKCGPDYIDPMFHKEAMQIESTNLDLFFCDANTVKYLISQNAANKDMAIIEGVMGFYDGVAGKSYISSAYDVAKTTDTPAVLVIDCKGKSVSILAEIKGFLELEEDNNIQGVILNRISDMIYKEIKLLIEEKLDIKVLGYIPVLKDCSFESRHLGLVTASEVSNIKEIINNLALQCEKTIDIEGLITLAKSAKPLVFSERKLEKIFTTQQNRTDNFRLAIAYDKAFCFYYKDNLELLKKLGAELVFFSPLNDEKVPSDICGLYIGGGYPELYLEQLSSNKKMLNSIKKCIESGIPTIAECGGFMYLHEKIGDRDSNFYNMVGTIKGDSYFVDKLVRFGYIEIKAKEDNLLCNKGETIRAHEFHYWDSTNNGESFIAQKPLRNRKWDCIVAKDNLFAGYPHMHFYSNVNAANRFVQRATEYKISRQYR